MTNYLTPKRKNAENQTYDTTCKEGTRFVHVLRKVCRSYPCAPGQDRNECRRVRREARVQQDNVLQLGNRICDSVVRQIAGTCKSVRDFCTHSDTKRIRNVRSATTTLTPSFLESSDSENFFIPIFLAWRNFARFSTIEFPESNRISEIIFEKIHKLWILLVDISIIYGYDARITLGSGRSGCYSLPASRVVVTQKGQTRTRES